MIDVKKKLAFTEEEQILYKRYIELSKKNEKIKFIKVPVFWVFENFNSSGTSLRLIYSDGNSIQRDIFDICRKFEVIDYKESGLSYAIIYKRVTHGIIFESEINQLFKLAFNPLCQWSSFK